ncbi:MAG: cbb3-type cytochrome oxidase assembly protein CcoS [Porticoccaceae bacterium]
MFSLMFLVPVAVILAIVAMGFFLWAVRNGQYDDLDKDGAELLFDDEKDCWG